MPQQLSQVHEPSQGGDLAPSVARADDAWLAEIAALDCSAPVAVSPLVEPGPGLARWVALRAKERAKRECAPTPTPEPANDDEPAEADPAPASPVIFPDGEPAPEPAPIEPAPASVRKKPNAGKSRLDPLADTFFVGEYLRERGVFPLPRGVPSPVLSVPGSSSPSSPSKKLAFLEKKISTAPTIPGTTTKTPSGWRYLSDEAQAIFAFVGLEDHGPVVGVSSHLSPEINAAAYSKAAPASWLHERVRTELDRAFARAVDFKLILEETNAAGSSVRKIHAHMVLALDLSSRRQAAKARAALLRAFGRCTGREKRRQFRYSHDIDVGWASYIAKDTRWAAPRMRAFLAQCGDTKLAPSFSGPMMTMTRGTTRLAKIMAENARQIVIAARQRPLAASESLTAPVPSPPASEPVSASWSPIAIKRPMPTPAIPEPPAALTSIWIAPAVSCRPSRPVPSTVSLPPRRRHATRIRHPGPDPPRSINVDCSQWVRMSREPFSTSPGVMVLRRSFDHEAAPERVRTMYSRRLTEAQVANTLEEMEVSVRKAVGQATVTTGESPQYGSTVLIQTPFDFHLLYEIAQGDEPDLEPTAEEIAEYRRNLQVLIAKAMAEGEAAAALPISD